MIQNLRVELWAQFGAAIDMLENSILIAEDEVWNSSADISHQAFHTLFFLDYYLSLNPVGFKPPEIFGYSEFEDFPPPSIFDRNEILGYLQQCRQKASDLILNLDEVQAEKRWINESKTMNFSIFEILLYNLRHVQHHAAQLNLLLRQKINQAPSWVFRAGEK
ncbi:DinB family protein [Algoriphagus boseongensis]|uniref:DinB family protein n=1 Tax=Algoriphagus boseongensis TaxID=1442587 RepID=A0A4R6TAP2_9BACT|nr:DinB family protein [Algoriphagus boseongensis]TDQ19283.1 DinB family protein [Algoriphagus boseongensis]